MRCADRHISRTGSGLAGPTARTGVRESEVFQHVTRRCFWTTSRRGILASRSAFNTVPHGKALDSKTILFGLYVEAEAIVVPRQTMGNGDGLPPSGTVMLNTDMGIVGLTETLSALVSLFTRISCLFSIQLFAIPVRECRERCQPRLCRCRSSR